MNRFKSESHILAELLESSRNLTKRYLGWLKDVDFEKRYPVKGVTLNNALWVTAHLVCAEHTLLIEALGKEPMKIPWIKEFRGGTKPLPPGKGPTFKEMLQKMDTVHCTALKAVKSLQDEDLNQPNALGHKFGEKNDLKRTIIHHAILHEAFHAGQLGWICKLNRIKTV
jgi:uncharacterized damage-inducible protein DinB